MAATLVADCPRCGVTKTTFDVLRSYKVGDRDLGAGGTLFSFESFCACRSCLKSTTFILARANSQSLPHTMDNDDVLLRHRFQMMGFINISNFKSQDVPEHVPDGIASPFIEGAKAYAIQCWNAAGCMFRATIDKTTIEILRNKEIDHRGKPETRQLGRRLKWMFDNGHLPEDLRELSRCIKEDGDDAAHLATLKGIDAQDLQEFSFHLLERMFTQPAKVKESEKRRNERRQKPPA